VTLRRSSDQYQLDQVFTLDQKEKDLTITMTLTNISGAMIRDVRIARAYDPDINHDFGDDLEVKSARGVWADDIDAVTLTGTTWGFPPIRPLTQARVPPVHLRARSRPLRRMMRAWRT
jgi:hypothetical protein